MLEWNTSRGDPFVPEDLSKALVSERNIPLVAEQ